MTSLRAENIMHIANRGLYWLGGTLAACAAGVFVAIALHFLNAQLTPWDAQTASWLHAHRAPWLTHTMLLVSTLNGTLAVSAYTLMLAAWLTRRRDWYWLLTLVAVPSGMCLNVLMKHAFHRLRPVFDDPLLILPTYSFPSGHVAHSTLFYGVLAAWLMSKPGLAQWRILAGLAAFVLVGLVAFSRMYLGVHYLSDVLAAFAEGLAWLALCLTIAYAYWQQRSPAGHHAATP